MSTVELQSLDMLKLHKDEVKALKIVRTSEGDYLFSAGKDKKAYCWNLNSTIDSEFGKVYKAYEEGHKRGITDIAVSNGGDMLVTVGHDNKGNIWDVKSKARVALENGHTGDILSVSVNCNDNKIVTGSVDKGLCLYNTKGELISSVKATTKGAHKGWVSCLAFHPTEENIIASGSSDGTIKIWNVDTMEVISTFMDGNLVNYEEAAEKKIKPYDYDDAKGVTAMNFTKDGSILAYGNKIGMVYLINMETNECIQSFSAKMPVRSIAAGETEPVIAVGTDEAILIWGTIESKIIAQYNLRKEVGNGAKGLAAVFSGNVLYCGLSSGDILPLELRK